MMAHRRHLRGRQYQRRVMISLTNVARSPTRKRMATLRHSRSPFFSVAARIRAHFKFPSKCHRTSPMRGLHGDMVTKKSAHITTECEALARLLKHYGSFSTFNRPVPLSRFRLCALRQNCVSRETLVIVRDSLVIIDFTIMHCPVASQLMHVQHPDWMHIDEHY